MKVLLIGGPLDGKEMETNRYLPAWDLVFPWSKVLEPETIETYVQHYQHIYQWVGSRPYYPLRLKINKE